MTDRRNPIRVKPVVDHAAGTVTFAVTFKWRKPWAMDHCEVGALGGHLRRTLINEFADWEQLGALVAVETWEPLEERHIGSRLGATPFHLNPPDDMPNEDELEEALLAAARPTAVLGRTVEYLESPIADVVAGDVWMQAGDEVRITVSAEVYEDPDIGGDMVRIVGRIMKGWGANSNKDRTWSFRPTQALSIRRYTS